MRNAPDDVVASWPEPNHENPVYQGPQLLIVGVILLALSIIVVALRLWVRLYMKNTAGWDDWIMVVAVVWLLDMPIASSIANNHRIDIHHLLYGHGEHRNNLWMGCVYWNPLMR